MHIGIIGAGHAGIEAAVAARQAGADVTVFSAEPLLPYFRPRLVAVAMGQTAPEEIAMHPAAWYEERGIRLRLDTAVAALDGAARTVTAAGHAQAFDALVLACGAHPTRPRFAGETHGMPVFTLWSMADAQAIRQRAHPGARLVVIGGASLGMESALRAAEQKLQVTLIERQPRLMPVLLGEAASAVLQRQVEARGVVVHTGRAVAGLVVSGSGVQVGLDDGTRLDADLVLVCIGAAPLLSLARQSGLASARGVLADAQLQVAPGVFAAGDVCQAAGRPARGAVREALVQGRIAGANAAAFVTGGALQAFAPAQVPTTVRCGGVEINVAGVARCEGTDEERLDDGSNPKVFRAVARRDGRIVSVQMIGTREGFDVLMGEMAQ
jgi:NAD(P)H-nitrite reductase large subunit